MPAPVGSPERYDYCVIFVRGAEPETVQQGLTEVLGRPFERDVVMLPELEVEVRHNPDFGNPLTTPDRFVVWPVQVELESTSPDAGQAMVATTTAVLEHLWTAGHDARAACDYEDELPWSGGRRRPGAAV